VCASCTPVWQGTGSYAGFWAKQVPCTCTCVCVCAFSGACLHLRPLVCRVNPFEPLGVSAGIRGPHQRPRSIFWVASYLLISVTKFQPSDLALAAAHPLPAVQCHVG